MKLKCGEPLSSVALNINVRRYTQDGAVKQLVTVREIDARVDFEEDPLDPDACGATTEVERCSFLESAESSVESTWCQCSKLEHD